MIYRNEQKGVAVLIILIIGFLIFKRLNQDNLINNIPGNSLSIEAVPLSSVIDSTNDNTKHQKTEYQKNYYSNKNKKKDKVQIMEFDFDPNNISKDSLIALGINSKSAYNWVKYISKGGHFRIKADIKKIYGITDKTYNRIQKHILLPNKIKYENKIAKSTKQKPDTTIQKENTYKKRYNNTNYAKKNYSFDINTCSKDDLIKLNGIGEVLSKRIIKFRDKLGGFYTINQVAKVYGLSEETFEKIKSQIVIKTPIFHKIKINKVDKNTLKNFPYISYRLAKQIINYRNNNGFFKNSEDFKKIKSINTETFKKIEPYLDFEE